MAADHFSWLHLTDFHYGLKGQDCLWPTLRQRFLGDLEKLHKRTGPWQAVLFTGDLVQSGSPAQFEEMQSEVLDRLWRKLRELGSENAILLAVPGNHDLCRPDPNEDDPAVHTLLRKEGFKGIADRFWDSPAGSYRLAVNNAFSAYAAWWGGAAQRPAVGVNAGILPGDFAYTLACGDRRIGIIGLNTTFLQLGAGDYRKRLVWNAKQIHEVCGGAVDDWLGKHDVCLLLTHQGPDWLTPECAEHGETEIAPPGWFAAHFFGHMHEAKIEYMATGGGDTIRRCQGCSVFGMEMYGDPPTSERKHGYTAGRIYFAQDKATLRLWPRIATREGGGAWRFIPDHMNASLSDDEATNPEAIALRHLLTTNYTPRKPGAKRSDFIAIPKPSWPKDLSDKGFGMPDSLMLRPESRIVRFHRLREPLRDSIVGWALDPDLPIKLRLRAGDGGSGKTRLLIEVCDKLEKDHGWRAGFVAHSQHIETTFPELLRERKPSLVVVDYAEGRTSEIIALTRTALQFPDLPLVRIVLLAREGGDWWNRLGHDVGDDHAAAAILRGLETKTGPYRMSKERIGESERSGVF